MIYQFLKSRLESVPVLAGAVYPTTVNIDEIEGTFAVYAFKSRAPVADLSGDIHHYVENILLDFLGESYDELHELYYQAEAALTVSNLDTGYGEYIFSASCANTEPDKFSPENHLLRRTMQVTIRWCPA